MGYDLDFALTDATSIPCCPVVMSSKMCEVDSQNSFQEAVSMRSIGITFAVIAMMVTVANAQTTQSQVTFTKNVAAILQDKCQVCHRPNTFAPMSLMTYEETRPWAKSIKAKVAAREMPPWYIDKNMGVQHFANDVSLTDEQIAMIVKWVDAGAPKGNDADMPPARHFEDKESWQIGQPDVIIPFD